MYSYTDVVIPPGTLESEPVKQTIKLSKGLIDYIEVAFPYGCCRLAHIQVFYHTVQILPLNHDNDLAYDDYVFKVNMQYPIKTEPYDVEVFAWNDDDTFPHEINIGVNVIQDEEQPDVTTLLTTPRVIESIEE